MQAEIITTGTELLLGTIVDTNAAYLSQQLSKIGLDLYFRTTVGDNAQRIATAIRQALNRSDVVITTGGLGPTVDDVTREALARVCAPLGFDIGSQTVPEIALSIVAELVACRNLGEVPDRTSRRSLLDDLPE